MDKKKWIALIGGAVLLLSGLLLKEDVKGLVCGSSETELPAQ